MIKKIVLFFLCFSIMIINVCADVGNAVTTETEQSVKVYTLTLEDAIKMALTDNLQLNACAEKKEDTKIQLESARDTKAQYRDINNIPISVSFELVYIKNGYYVHSYEKALKLSDYEYNQIEAQIAYRITEKYFNLKNCIRLVEITQNSYDLIFENYKNSSLSYELGMISKSELDYANLALMQAQNTLDDSKRNYDIAVEDFKIALNLNNHKCEFVLTTDLNVDDFSANLMEDLTVAENSRYDIAALKMNYELAEEYMNLTLGGAISRKSAAKSSYITAKYNYINNTSLILLGIKSSYNNVISSKNNMYISQESLRLKNNDYNISKIKYEQGLITNTELLTSLNNLYTAEIEYENSKLNYRLSVDKYKYDVKIGI